MHNPLHLGSHSVSPALWLWAVTTVAADIWPEAWTSFDNFLSSLTSPLYAEASPTLDNTQAAASINQDNSRNAKTIGGRANEVGDKYTYGFLNIHLSSAGYIGIAFSIIVAIIILAFFCSAKCKQRWRRNEQMRRREMNGEAPPEGETGPRDPREPREPGIMQALARRISNPPMSERSAAHLQLMDKIHRMERIADRLNGSQTDMDTARQKPLPPNPLEEPKIAPVPAERRTTKERKASISQEDVIDRARETALRLALAGMPAKEIIPRVIAEVKEEEEKA